MENYKISGRIVRRISGKQVTVSGTTSGKARYDKANEAKKKRSVGVLK